MEIPLSKGYVATVDPEDYEAVVAAGPWHVLVKPTNLYARRWHRRPDGTGASQGLHTFLTGWPLVDHRDGDGLNNRRSNLRPATQAQNLANSQISKHNTSGYKGVARHVQSGRWQAGIKVSGVRRHIGLYDTAEDAARAYDLVHRVLWGEFARPNFPDRPQLEPPRRPPSWYPGQPEPQKPRKRACTCMYHLRIVEGSVGPYEPAISGLWLTRCFSIMFDCPHHGDDLLDIEAELDVLYPDGGVWGFTAEDC